MNRGWGLFSAACAALGGVALLMDPQRPPPPVPPAAVAQPSFNLEITANSTVRPWVTDAAGRGVGVNPETALVRLQVPGASYSGLNANPQAVIVPNALGSYHVRLSGASAGPIHLAVRAFDPSHPELATEYTGTGDVQPESVLTTNIELSRGPNGSPLLTAERVEALAGNT